jgi:hypothetical protein
VQIFGFDEANFPEEFPEEGASKMSIMEKFEN